MTRIRYVPRSAVLAARLALDLAEEGYGEATPKMRAVAAATPARNPHARAGDVIEVDDETGLPLERSRDQPEPVAQV